MSAPNKNKLSWQEFHVGLVSKACKDEAFRKMFLNNPKEVLEKELGQIQEGIKLPENLIVKVLEKPSDTLYFILPVIAYKGAELSEEQLEAVAGGGTDYNMFSCGPLCACGPLQTL